jgi:UDP-glucuronate 4-epimerase
MAVARFTRLIDEGREVPVYGDGTAKRDFTYIGDIMKGLLAAVYKSYPYEIINLGESRTVEVRRLISVIEERLGKKAQIRYLPPAPGDVPVTYADVKKAKKLLGYEPEVTIEKGIDRYVRWYIERKGSSAPA